MDIFRQLNTRTWSIVSAEGQASVECASCRRSCVERPRAISVEVRKSIDASSAVHDEALLQVLAILKRLSYPKVERLPAEQLRVSLEGVFCDVRLSARTCRFYAATSRILPHRSGSATTTCGGGALVVLQRAFKYACDRVFATCACTVRIVARRRDLWVTTLWSCSRSSTLSAPDATP